LSPATDRANLPPTRSTETLDELWAALEDDPGRQALETAWLCYDQAPHLKDYLYHKISAALPDQEYKRLLFHQPSDGRIQALNLLAQINSPRRPVETPDPPHYPGYPLPQRTEAISFETRVQTVVQQFLGRVPVSDESPPAAEAEPIRTEPELGRICVGGYCGSEFRLWTICRHLTREGDGSGKVSKKALRAILERFGISYTRQHLNRLLAAGNRLFWNLSKRSIYLRNPTYIATRLIALYPDLAVTNRPGVRDVYLSPAGSLEQWEAMIYIGWLTHREGLTISREELERLFNRDQETLRRWEQTRLSGMITVRRNFAQADPRQIPFTPPLHSQPYVAEVHTASGIETAIRVYWQLPNTYDPHGIRQHPYKGQARKTRKAANNCFDPPADERRGGMHRLKRYFDSGESLRSYTQQHQTQGYLWRGENRQGVGMFEPSENGFGVTTARERAGFKTERRLFYRLGNP
jgi:hypothetical protein